MTGEKNSDEKNEKKRSTFKDYLSSVRPPPDGRYLWSVVKFQPNLSATTVTLEVIDGEHTGKRLVKQLWNDSDQATIETLLVVLGDAQTEDDFVGRKLYATKVTKKSKPDRRDKSGRQSQVVTKIYLNEISSALDDDDDAETSDDPDADEDADD